MNKQERELFIAAFWISFGRTIYWLSVIGAIVACVFALIGCCRRCALDPTLEREQDLKERVVGNSDACQKELHGDTIPPPSTKGVEQAIERVEKSMTAVEQDMDDIEKTLQRGQELLKKKIQERDAIEADVRQRDKEIDAVRKYQSDNIVEQKTRAHYFTGSCQSQYKPNDHRPDEKPAQAKGACKPVNSKEMEPCERKTASNPGSTVVPPHGSCSSDDTELCPDPRYVGTKEDGKYFIRCQKSH